MDLTRIGIFYDGNFFARVSDYYRYYHDRKSRISIQGLHDFVRQKTADLESSSYEMCQVVDAHYFRGRFSARETKDYKEDQLYYDRLFDDVLMRSGVITHYLPIFRDRDRGEDLEKGIDVWLALEAYELTVYKKFSMVVLIAGDGDFLPLIRKLNTIGTKVMLLAWDFEFEDRMGKKRRTRTAQTIIDESTYVLQMDQIINSRKSDKLVDGLFLPPDNHLSGPPVPPPIQMVPVGAASGTALTGLIKRTIEEYDDDRYKRYGFIAAKDGSDYYFNETDLSLEISWPEIREGLEVTFEVKREATQEKAGAARDVRRAE